MATRRWRCCGARIHRLAVVPRGWFRVHGSRSSQSRLGCVSYRFYSVSLASEYAVFLANQWHRGRHTDRGSLALGLLGEKGRVLVVFIARPCSIGAQGIFEEIAFYSKTSLVSISSSLRGICSIFELPTPKHLRPILGCGTGRAVRNVGF